MNCSATFLFFKHATKNYFYLKYQSSLSILIFHLHSYFYFPSTICFFFFTILGFQKILLLNISMMLSNNFSTRYILKGRLGSILFISEKFESKISLFCQKDPDYKKRVISNITKLMFTILKMLQF